MIRLLDRETVTLGIIAHEQCVMRQMPLTVSVLETLDLFLGDFGYSFHDVTRLGILEGEASFSSTRLTMILSAMGVSYGGMTVALLPSDFFEQTPEMQVAIYTSAVFTDQLLSKYRAEPAITTPKKV